MDHCYIKNTWINVWLNDNTVSVYVSSLQGLHKKIKLNYHGGMFAIVEREDSN